MQPHLPHVSCERGVLRLYSKELTAYILPSKTFRTLRLESNKDRHCPAAATGVEQGTTRTFSM